MTPAATISGPTSTATVPSGVYAAPQSTNVAIVDQVIAAGYSGKPDQVAKLIHFASKPCSDGGGIGAIPCPTGTSPGTGVEVVLVGSCEGNYVTEGADLDSVVAHYTPPNAFLYAVVTTGSNSWTIVFATNATSSAIVYEMLVDAGGITNFHASCGPTDPAKEIAGKQLLLGPPQS